MSTEIIETAETPEPEAFRSLFRRVWWQVAVRIARTILFLGSSVRVTGREHIPPTGPVILASNHISHFDPPLLSTVCPRPVDWVAMSELYQAEWSRKLFLSLNAIPIKRGAPDRAAIREAQRRLAAGRLVGIFPEGGLRAGEESLLQGAQPLRGAGLLARLSGAPVVPCAIIGSERLYNKKRWRPGHRAPVWVAFGPILPPNLKDQEFAEALRSSLQSLCHQFLSQGGATQDDLPKTPQERIRE